MASERVKRFKKVKGQELGTKVFFVTLELIVHNVPANYEDSFAATYLDSVLMNHLDQKDLDKAENIMAYELASE